LVLQLASLLEPGSIISSVLVGAREFMQENAFSIPNFHQK